MAKGRSAISKSMAHKNTRAPAQHVSGLSSSKSASKRKNETVKFGSLSRKQKNDLKEYGTLIPDDFQDDEEDEENDNAESGEEGGPTKRRRRVVYEEDLDREMEEGQVQFESEEDEEEGDDEEEETWQKPSAYSQLVGSLQKTSKNQTFYARIKREQEGFEDEDSDGDDEDEEEQEVHDENDMAVNDAEEENEEEEKDEEVEEEDDGEGIIDEEEKQDQIMVGDESSDEEEGREEDPFSRHFTDDQPKEFDQKISLIEDKKWNAQTFEDDALKDVVGYTAVPDKSIKESKPVTDLVEAKVRGRLAKLWKKANKNVLDSEDESRVFTPLQDRLFQQFNEYRDVMYCNRSLDNADEIRNAYVLHALNHIHKTRDRIMRNTNKITKAQTDNIDIGDIRDQGFTRPKVLIVVPFRNSVVDIVDMMIKLSGSEQQENKKRFYDEYKLREKEEQDDTKPADFLATFKGNIDDHFRLAIKFTRKSMKFYSDYYAADMIIASPLGLRMMIGAEGDKKQDFDFLSSIELVIFDQASTFLMQNWEHVEHIFQFLNRIPLDTHGCDISRIKNWYLDKKATYLRQTLVFSEFLTPEFNAIFNKYFKNVAGKLKIKQKVEDGSILDVIPQVQQTFTRVDTTSLAAMDDTRFKYFVEKTLPGLRKSAIMQSHTLIFIPSYFDFVRIRNYFEDNMYSYEPLCEYTTPKGITRARGQFFHGRTSFLLYTERVHFFRRLNIRGTFHVVFYGLPDHPQFYNEVVNFLGLKFNEASAAEEATFSCTALFSRYDHLKLERIVGTERAQKMCTAQKNVFMFA
ncbi:hypothetical protein BDB00DRAFT_38877 [Zychaea mexicana]|uniref:uncharacterized protein n=1 Tax=Zychaea mexicana TaxID=64656 RepID=UPI0022FDC7E3|nr:uncharacterized protein BDB00DRAFT_38877 [Zychaea mexicana]KAI9488556.1 hypothetical protein BDB00DRAFT_38877 [Zychaea mexicana]